MDLAETLPCFAADGGGGGISSSTGVNAGIANSALLHSSSWVSRKQAGGRGSSTSEEFCSIESENQQQQRQQQSQQSQEEEEQEEQEEQEEEDDFDVRSQGSFEWIEPVPGALGPQPLLAAAGSDSGSRNSRGGVGSGGGAGVGGEHKADTDQQQTMIVMELCDKGCLQVGAMVS